MPFFKSLVWLDLGLNPGLSDHWWILYPLHRQNIWRKTKTWTTRERLVPFWTITGNNTPTKYQLYCHLLPISEIIRVKQTRHAGEVRTNSQATFFMNSYTWTHQCWLTSEDLYTSTLCKHGMQPKRSARNDG